jgi:drug/metabolite transporter (DMT)-like permease
MGFTLNLGMFMAFDRITVALALLAFYTYPVLVTVGNAALGREPLDGSTMAALALAVAGMTAVVASQLDPAMGIRLDIGGVGLAFAAAASQAVFVILSRRGYRVVPADQAIGLVLGVTVACGTAVAVFTGAAATLARPLEAPTLLPLLLFTGFFGAAIPSILFLTGIRLLGGTGAGIVMLFEPVVGVVLAAWLLAEGLAPIQILGGVAILAAAIVLQRSTRPDERVVAAPAIEADPITQEAAPAALPFRGPRGEP